MLIKRFPTKGYNLTNLQKVANEVGRMSRSELLNQRVIPINNKNTKRLTFVSKFSSASMQIEQVVKKCWPILQQDKVLKQHCMELPLFCYTRGQTLKDKLCPAELRTIKKQSSLFKGPPKKGTFPCLNCICCASIIKGDIVYHPISGKAIQLKSYATCESVNAIYLLKCPCGLVYIGQTSRAVKERIKEHKSNIRNFKAGSQSDTSISRHFSFAKHNVSQLKWQVLGVISRPQRGGNVSKLLLQEEAKWIKKLNSLHPEGLNEHWNISSFL
ncbi:hypothetical protein XELAEV_18036011mg [Xenopus laevis]|uniref:GIY-YIG domain-containing protein n=1 Tax=Xenopus laevis TaxID=8355 RepID=A0A974CHG0_XENLA|nr:hypothetical protein XELAEV_18036011mg [Xenopus laevis]